MFTITVTIFIFIDGLVQLFPLHTHHAPQCPRGFPYITVCRAVILLRARIMTTAHVQWKKMNVLEFQTTYFYFYLALLVINLCGPLLSTDSEVDSACVCFGSPTISNQLLRMRLTQLIGQLVVNYATRRGWIPFLQGRKGNLRLPLFPVSSMLLELQLLWNPSRHILWSNY